MPPEEKKKTPKLVFDDLDVPKFVTLAKDGKPFSDVNEDGRWYVTNVVDSIDGQQYGWFFAEEQADVLFKYFKATSDDPPMPILIKGTKLTLTLTAHLNQTTGRTFKSVSVEMGGTTDETTATPETSSSAPPPLPNEHAPLTPSTKEHPYAPSSDHGGKRPQFSEIVDLIHTCFVATGWILREEDETDVASSETRQAMTATLFIGCQKAGITLTKEQAKLAVKYYSKTAGVTT